MEASGGMDAAPVRLSLETLRDPWIYDFMVVAHESGQDTEFDPDGFYSSHGDQTPEAFGARPRRTVANADCNAPPTVALTTESFLPGSLDGGDAGASSLPAAPPPCNGPRMTRVSETSGEPFFFDKPDSLGHRLALI